MFIVLLGVVTLTFFLMRVTEGDPATIIALDKYGSQLISHDVIKRLAFEEGLNKPLHIQFYNWIKTLFSGNLGKSLRSGVPVWDEIMSRFPYTLQLAFLSILFTALISVPLGIYSGFHKNGYIDRFTKTTAAFTVSIPNFYLAIVLILAFSVKLVLVPSYGYGGIEHFILPLIVLVVSKAGYTIRIVRSTTIDILSRDYVRYAYVRGLPEHRILFVHVLKNALIPIITYLSIQFLMAIEGSVIVETIFAWPGVGKLMQEAIFGRDFTMIQGLVLFIAVLITMINFIVDVLYIFINRRLNLSEKGIMA
jgi:peptide/nickel transport system permease protein